MFPISEPACFIGQLPIEAPALFHDHGALYVFFNKRAGQFETAAQFYCPVLEPV